tara:strand:+ start:510 stop:1055 length:546 start_codon:yes stop_codon:yes gene_type:complete
LNTQPLSAQLRINAPYNYETKKFELVPLYFPASQAINNYFKTGMSTWVFLLNETPFANASCLASFSEMKHILRCIVEDPALVGFSVEFKIEYPLGTTVPSKTLLDNYRNVDYNKKESVNVKVGFKHNKSVGERNETGEKRVMNFLDKQIQKIVIPATPITLDDMTEEERIAWHSYHVFGNR